MSALKGKTQITDDLDVDDMDFPLPDHRDASKGIQIGQSYGDMKVVNDSARFKTWVCLYPLYFDRTRSVNDGRKVPKSLAIESPHARQLSLAVKEVGFNVCYEPHKSHPRDFFNPGRVRVELFDHNGKPMRLDIANRKRLMRYVAEKLPLVDAPREKEPSLQDLIDSGAMPVLPGMPPPGAQNESTSSGPGLGGSSSGKQPKKAGKLKKGKVSKNIV